MATNDVLDDDPGNTNGVLDDGPGNTNGSDSDHGAASINRIRLDAQRRSAHHSLSEYLVIRRRILSRRAPTTQPPSEESDARWIRKLIRDTMSTSSGGRRAGSASGPTEELVSDVWELIVVRDQLASDLIMLGLMLDRVSERSKTAATRSLVYPGATMLLGLLLPPAGQADFWYRYVRGAVWAVFGLCAVCSCLHGLRTALAVWLRRLVSVVQEGAENELIPQFELGPLASSLSFWGWSILQFSPSHLFG